MGFFSSKFCVVGLGHMSIAKTLADVKFTFNPDLLHSLKKKVCEDGIMVVTKLINLMFLKCQIKPRFVALST